MKHLAIASMLASLATGCVIADDGYYDYEEGAIGTTWSFHMADGTQLGCPAGFDTAEITAVPRDGSEAFIDLYDCGSLSGRAFYPVNDYEVTIAVTNRSGSQEYAHSLTQTVDIFVTDANLGEDFIHDGGRLLFDWVLVDAQSNDALECRGAGNPSSINVAAVNGDTTISTSLACGDGFGVSAPLPAGAYTATFSALNAAGQPLGEPQTAPVAVRDRNDYDDLGTIMLPIGMVAPSPD